MAIDAGTLQQLAMLGLGENVSNMTPQELEDALYGRAEADINRRSGLDAQAALENTFARGVGMGGTTPGAGSTISADAVTPIMRTRNDALLKARMDAFTASQAARLAALGQAAAVSQNALSSGASAGAQQTALALQRRGQNIQQETATNQLVGQGVGGVGGAALSTAGLVYAPEIKNRLRALLSAGGGGETKTAAAGAPGTGDTLGPPSPTAGQSGLAGLAESGAGPAAIAPSYGAPAAPGFSPVSFDLPSSPGFGSGGGLGDLAQWNFNPGDVGMEDWLNNAQPAKTWGDYL